MDILTIAPRRVDVSKVDGTYLSHVREEADATLTFWEIGFDGWISHKAPGLDRLDGSTLISTSRYGTHYEAVCLNNIDVWLEFWAWEIGINTARHGVIRRNEKVFSNLASYTHASFRRGLQMTSPRP